MRMNADERGLDEVELRVQRSMGRFGGCPLGRRFGKDGGPVDYLFDCSPALAAAPAQRTDQRLALAASGIQSA